MTRRAFSTLAERIAWLLAHPEFLRADFLGGVPTKRAIVLLMQCDGLVSKKTFWPDVNLDDAIREAKIRWFAAHKR